jgi:hypothetical protein
MMVPHAESASVERQKIVDYLLNPAHPDNGGKARFFQRLGFSAENWEALRDALCVLATKFPIAEFETSPHGSKYVVSGELIGPSANAATRTVWIVERGSQIPRLVTAYPQR